jgi:predicted Holliday junction resolvase-like endonuclease
MMESDVVKFFALQRQIFGVCPKCQDFFRLSDCKIYLRKKPVLDWMDKIDSEHERLDKAKERLEEEKAEIREKAREEGRKLAQLTIKKIDPIFTPRKLNPDDSKVIFHPIDYIVFNGMKEGESIKNIILLDRKEKGTDHRALQKSIERVVERKNYEWQTLRVQEDGKIRVESRMT